MISLARQLALRREIEEEMGDLAGRLGFGGEQLGLGARWGESGAEEKAHRAAKQRARFRAAHPLARCDDCGRAKRTNRSPRCDACRPAFLRRAHSRSTEAWRKRKRAERRAAMRCIDCRETIPDLRHTNRKRCKTCRAKVKSRRVCARQKLLRDQRRAAQQRRAS